jgi:hypothetical protein
MRREKVIQNALEETTVRAAEFDDDPNAFPEPRRTAA